MPSKPRNKTRDGEPRHVDLLNRNEKTLDTRWDAYIASMRGTMTSVRPDIHKVDAATARRGAAERFTTGRDQARANRNAFCLSAVVKRQSG